MKKVPATFLLCGSAFAQNHSPQPNFPTQVNLAGSSLWMNFNDFTSAFKDQVSGLTFNTVVAVPSIGTDCIVGNASTSSLSCSLTTTATDALIVFIYLPSGTTIPSLTDSLGATAMYYATNSGSGYNTYTYYFKNIVSGSHTIAATLSGTTAYPQMRVVDAVNVSTTAPIDTAVYNSSGTATYSPLVGPITPSNTNEMLLGQISMNGGASAWTAGTPAFTLLPGTYPNILIGSRYNVNAAPTTFHATNVNSLTYNATLLALAPGTHQTSDTVTVRQPGFDSTQINNTSAEFAYNSLNLAPNNTLGAIEWNSPWTMLIHVDRLNWNRSGTLVLASKGDSSTTTTSWWKLVLSMNGSYSEICFTRNGYGNPPITGASGQVQNGICTNSYFDAMPNGFNYDIVLTDNGTGASGSSGYSPGQQALQLYVNGLNQTYIPQTSFSNSYSAGFGYATLVAAGGTGYAAATAFTSSGGGSNCVVYGTMNASGGIPLPAISLTVDYGCTSVPTITLTTPTGTGVSLTVGLGGGLMNASTLPLMVPGYVSGGSYFGVAGVSSTQNPTYVDEFALFPGVLNQTQIQSLFYQTKFYQSVVKTLPSTPYTLVFDNDGCADSDNLFALALAIAAQRIGYIRLAGVVDTAGDGVSEAMYRQMLDQAGLAQIPMAVSSSFGSTSGLCVASNINTFNASTPQTTASYPQAKTMYRQIFANNPTTPVFIMLGGSFRGVADLMQSSADSISSLTGAQLIALNAANGGAIYAQGLGANISFTGDNSLQDWTAGQYVVQNNGAMPIYWYGGQPQITGPGVLSTRTGKDPFFLAATTFGADTRQGYDSLPTQSFLSSLFAGGVNVAISGSGTGYAAQTPFTSTGGGANCVVTGFMLSTSGVPSSVISTSGVAGVNTYDGIGSGCVTAASPPTITLTTPTGTGAVLTATTTASVCGKVTITSATSGSTSTATCSNHYFLPFSLNAASSPVQGALMEWFINSLVDPLPSGAPRAR